MSLLNILKGVQSPLDSYRIDQILAMCADGNLKDGSRTSSELRTYLTSVSLDRLEKHANEVLGKSFQDSGFVLQDLVNEIGRRLGFEVENGRYRGVINQSGHDGLWRTSSTSIVVEVKTTDAYRINNSTLAKYATLVTQAESDAHTLKANGVLLVVGRQDTGDLEAQIRGSRYAWDVRVISVEALIGLARLRELAIDSETEIALQNALIPVEFTRVDHLVSLLSRIAFDAERSFQVEQEFEDDLPKVVEMEGNHNPSENSINQDNTPIGLEILRANIIKDCEAFLGSSLIQCGRGKAQYASADAGAVIISLSRRYKREYQNYWYAFQEQWCSLLNSLGSYICLGLQDKSYYLRIPSSALLNNLPHLNKTQKARSSYWHLSLIDKNDRISMSLPKTGKLLDLSDYKIGF